MTSTCSEFRENWGDWQAGALDERSAARQAAERARCPACARYDRQMRKMLSALTELPLPDEMPPARLGRPESAYRAPRLAGRALATAAMLVVAFSAGWLAASLPLTGTDNTREAVYADAVEIRPTQVQEIQIAFAAQRHIDDVEFTVELPPGVELDGYPGQRVVRWNGRLKPGSSRLTLPVRATGAAGDAELVARIRHDGGGEELHVPLRLADRMSVGTGSS